MKTGLGIDEDASWAEVGSALSAVVHQALPRGKEARLAAVDDLARKIGVPTDYLEDYLNPDTSATLGVFFPRARELLEIPWKKVFSGVARLDERSRDDLAATLTLYLSSRNLDSLLDLLATPSGGLGWQVASAFARRLAELRQSADFELPLFLGDDLNRWGSNSEDCDVKKERLVNFVRNGSIEGIPSNLVFHDLSFSLGVPLDEFLPFRQHSPSERLEFAHRTSYLSRPAPREGSYPRELTLPAGMDHIVQHVLARSEIVDHMIELIQLDHALLESRSSQWEAAGYG